MLCLHFFFVDRSGFHYWRECGPWSCRYNLLGRGYLRQYQGRFHLSLYMLMPFSSQFILETCKKKMNNTSQILDQNGDVTCQYCTYTIWPNVCPSHYKNKGNSIGPLFVAVIACTILGRLRCWNIAIGFSSTVVFMLGDHVSFLQLCH